MSKPKFAQNAAELKSDNGEITFIAARNVQNLNGYTYDVKSLQAQNSDGDYQTISNEETSVSIPLMVDHGNSVKEKIGNIDTAKIENADGIDQVVMHATFFKGEESQAVRQRVLDGELTDVSITTDWGSDEEAWETGNLENARIVEVSVVYAGAEPKAKILAKNSVDTDDEKPEEDEEETPDTSEATPPETEAPAETEPSKPEDETGDDEEEDASDENDGEETKESDEESEEKEEEMATQPTNATESTERVATKEQVLNALANLAKNGSLKGLNRNQVIEAVQNDVVITDGGQGTYTVPDAVFTEIFLHERDTDILSTFNTTTAKRRTFMMEDYSDAELNRAGKYTKGIQKVYQELKLNPQVLNTQFLYKLQKLDYEDMQEDFGDILYAAIKTELPQKLDEEEERAYLVGDGRSAGNRKITSVVSIDAAAEDNANIHAVKYDGSSSSSVLEALLDGVSAILGSGTRYAAMSRTTFNSLKKAGLSSAAGLPFTETTVADAIGVDKIFVRDYIANDVAYAWRGNGIQRLTSPNDNIEQYDIDFNQQKIEVLRRVGGAPTQLATAVKIELPEVVSA